MKHSSLFPSFRLRFAGALALLAVAAGCGDVGPEVGGLAGDVARQRQIWEARRSDRYVFELERQCFCAEDARGPVRITVDGSRAVSRVYTGSGREVAVAFADLFPTVDGLFDVLEDALERSADRVDVTWDPVSGAPSSFFIDYSLGMADEELGFRILAGPSGSVTP